MSRLLPQVLSNEGKPETEASTKGALFVNKMVEPVLLTLLRFPEDVDLEWKAPCILAGKDFEGLDEYAVQQLTESDG